jgi:hypothetical protein
VEISYLEFRLGTMGTNHPFNGTTIQNSTTNSDGALPYGEVFFRSAVFDPVRGYAYFGQDSRPNQIVKVKLTQIDPITLIGSQLQTNGSFQFSFTNIAGAQFNALMATNVALPGSNWAAAGAVTEISPGHFQCADPQATNSPQRFYRVRSQ